jgi:hypothetical protein
VEGRLKENMKEERRHAKEKKTMKHEKRIEENILGPM